MTGEAMPVKPLRARERIRDVRVFVVGALLTLLLTQPIWPRDGVHEVVEYLGFALTGVCVLGRSWSALYVSGWKKQRLLTVGPFSITRNPLYVFSFIGVVGTGMIAESVTFTLIAVFAFGLYYGRVVRREEAFLAEKFGAAFETYRASVPRWLPRFGLYHSPETLEIKPRRVLVSMRDSLWFLAVFPLLELIEWLHAIGWLPNLLRLP